MYVVLLLLVTAACGRVHFQADPDAGTSGRAIGGTVTGLAGSLTLSNNASDELTRTTDGVFTFTRRLAEGAPYQVAVEKAPGAQSCTIVGGTGSVAGADVRDVAVTCTTRAGDGIQCAAALSCGLAGEQCCHDRGTEAGACGAVGDNCSTQLVFCDEASDCGTGVCCARYATSSGNLQDVRCKAVAADCSGPASQTFEFLCNPADAAACPTGMTCTGAPRYTALGWRVCE